MRPWIWARALATREKYFLILYIFGTAFYQKSYVYDRDRRCAESADDDDMRKHCLNEDMCLELGLCVFVWVVEPNVIL